MWRRTYKLRPLLLPGARLALASNLTHPTTTLFTAPNSADLALPTARAVVAGCRLPAACWLLACRQE
ncbi:hypothetical protein HZH66_015294 [Vespula vulgaris]|uniref:Uncharacterized protein n=1 Tax=Vespula vulgaris TaxID=7454 RepID=A0A834IZ45_VESVU|nr:hypothetical protein HZH66_015294 [Vespula vulgaris]